MKNKHLRVQRMDAPVLSALRLFPGISVEFVQNVLSPPLQGLVLQAYGVGNGPGRNREFVKALAEASRRGVVIVDCTQCLHGAVDLSEYAAGSALAKAGVISGYDLTVEAALAKLNFLFSQGFKPEKVRREMQRDLRGEMTVPAQRAVRP
jgi:L-asparaginase